MRRTTVWMSKGRFGPRRTGATPFVAARFAVVRFAVAMHLAGGKKNAGRHHE
jgi:hypothetical protein